MADRERIRDFILRRVQAKGRLPAGCDIDAYDFRSSGAIDSMGIIKFMLEIEAEFDIAIEDAEIESPAFTTIGGLADMIARKLKSD